MIPAPASTVVLVRGAGVAREVLLLRRPPGSAFAPDAWVFPGGRLDPSDYEFQHDRLAVGPRPAEWGSRLGLNSAQAAAYPVAALREAWEETGILLVDGGEAAELDGERSALLAGRLTLAAALGERNLRLATGRLRYAGRRITPAGFPRRFDTRFFVAEVSPLVRCTLLGEELAEARWTTLPAALGAAANGSISMLPPTLDTLRRLQRGDL